MCRVRGASAAEAPLRAQTPRSCRRAQVWLEGESSAELQAIAMTARHRLERGIWTSPGAGAAACCFKRLVHGGSLMREHGAPSARGRHAGVAREEAPSAVSGGSACGPPACPVCVAVCVCEGVELS